MSNIEPMMSRSTTCPDRQRLSPDTWDTHVHVFDSSMGAFAPNRAYTPAEAPLTELLRFSRDLAQGDSPSNLVLVQPSPYGSDNTILLQALKQLRNKKDLSARGIAVLDLNNTTDHELNLYHSVGIRGLRLNKVADGQHFCAQDLANTIRKTAERIKHQPGWKIQLFISGSTWSEIYPTLCDLPVEIIADHLGGMAGSSSLDLAIRDPRMQPGFEALVRLAEQSKVYIKISGLYRMSSREQDGYSDLEPIIRTLAERVPERLIFASDWPHTGEPCNREAGGSRVEAFRKIDNDVVIGNIRRWIGNEQTWYRMTVETPAKAFR